MYIQYWSSQTIYCRNVSYYKEKTFFFSTLFVHFFFFFFNEMHINPNSITQIHKDFLRERMVTNRAFFFFSHFILLALQHKKRSSSACRLCCLRVRHFFKNASVQNTFIKAHRPLCLRIKLFFLLLSFSLCQFPELLCFLDSFLILSFSPVSLCVSAFLSLQVSFLTEATALLKRTTVGGRWCQVKVCTKESIFLCLKDLQTAAHPRVGSSMLKFQLPGCSTTWLHTFIMAMPIYNDHKLISNFSPYLKGLQ